MTFPVTFGGGAWRNSAYVGALKWAILVYDA